MLVFDIETIPDDQLIESTHGMTIPQYRKSIDKDFLPLQYHKIVSIGVTILDDQMFINETKSITVGLELDGKSYTEEKIIAAFDKMLSKYGMDTIVSYNGKGFDIPVIMLRSMKYQLSLPHINHEVSNYKSYLHKWNDDMHLDLINMTPAYEKMSLHEACMLCGFKGKDKFNGKDVEDLSPESIDKYVRRDTLVTTKLMYHYLLMKGKLDISKFNDLVIQPDLHHLL